MHPHDFNDWAVFAAIVVSLLALDLGVFHRKTREIGIRESLQYSLFYIAVSVAFGVWVGHDQSVDKAREFFTGYVVEKSLSLDNIFVMSLIFNYFAIPRALQHRVLFWGILGVVILRGMMIGLGAAIIERYDWVLLFFAAFLIYTGIKMLLAGEEDEADFASNPVLRFIRNRLRVTDGLRGRAFFVRLPHPSRPSAMKTYATPLFLVLVLIEFADLIFAFDSVPAIFAITRDPYVVFTSNIFAILGLRSLFFALSALLPRFAYLRYALSLVLVFIGGKVFAAEFLDIEKIPASISLGVTFTLLAGGVLFSLYKTRGVALSEKEE